MFSDIKRIKTFLLLPIGDKLLILEAMILLLFVWGGLAVVSFDRFRLILSNTVDFSPHGFPDRVSIEQIVESINAVDSLLPGDRTCLVRSLSAEFLLRAYNHNFEHRIGVSKTAGGKIKAHSWIEHDGKVVLGELDDLETYEPLPPMTVRE